MLVGLSHNLCFWEFWWALANEFWTGIAWRNGLGCSGFWSWIFVWRRYLHAARLMGPFVLLGSLYAIVWRSNRAISGSFWARLVRAANLVNIWKEGLWASSLFPPFGFEKQPRILTYFADVHIECPDDMYPKWTFYVSELISDSYEYIPVHA